MITIPVQFVTDIQAVVNGVFSDLGSFIGFIAGFYLAFKFIRLFTDWVRDSFK